MVQLFRRPVPQQFEQQVALPFLFIGPIRPVRGVQVVGQTLPCLRRAGQQEARSFFALQRQLVRRENRRDVIQLALDCALADGQFVGDLLFVQKILMPQQDR